jgi:hypothetical protein
VGAAHQGRSSGYRIAVAANRRRTAEDLNPARLVPRRVELDLTAFPFPWLTGTRQEPRLPNRRGTRRALPVLTEYTLGFPIDGCQATEGETAIPAVAKRLETADRCAYPPGICPAREMKKTITAIAEGPRGDSR